MPNDVIKNQQTMKQYTNVELDRMMEVHEPTPAQLEIIQLYKKGVSWEKIAEQRNCGVRSSRQMFQQYVKDVKRKGYDPHAEAAGVASDGYFVKRKSQLVRNPENGEYKWVISEPEKERQFENILKAIEHTATSFTPAKAIPAPRKNLTKDLVNTYVFTDYHLAMYAFGKETGDDWNVQIAVDTFRGALQEMMDHTPDTELGLFVQGGDFLHWDSIEPVTPMSKHIVDADTRADVMVETALQMHLEAITMLLTKHKKVHVIAMEGNHDMMGSIWIRKCLLMYFKNNKRVTIDDTAFPYYAYLHGDIMLGFHHGHKKKNKDLPALFASEPRYREMWGAAKYCYIHTGHYHQREQDMTEYGGAVIERHPTLAARDAYAARGGFVSWRAANAITYCKKRGEVARKVVYPEVDD